MSSSAQHGTSFCPVKTLQIKQRQARDNVMLCAADCAQPAGPGRADPEPPPILAPCHAEQGCLGVCGPEAPDGGGWDRRTIRHEAAAEGGTHRPASSRVGRGAEAPDVRVAQKAESRRVTSRGIKL